MQETSYNRIDKQKQILYLLLFRLTVDFMYIFILRREYDNISLLALGYSRNAFSFHFDPARIAMSYIMTIVFVVYVVNRILNKDQPHELLATSLLCLSLIPNLTMFAFSDIRWSFFWLLCLFWGLLFFFIKLFTKKEVIQQTYQKADDISLNREKRNAKIVFWIIALVFIVGSAIFSIVYNGGIRFNISFSNDIVYENRLAARGTIGLVTNYFRNNAMFVVLPILAISFMAKKKYILFVVSIIVLFLLFTVDSLKVVFFLTVISIIAALIIKNKINTTIIKGLVVLNILVIVIYLLTGNLVVVDYLVKRVYFLPSIIGRCFFEYVGSHGNQVFFSSFFKGIGLLSNYAYSEVQLPFMIGRTYFGSINISANTGGFGGAYAYGIPAVMIIPAIYAFLFKLLDKVTYNIEPKYYISFVILNAYVITNASLPSVLIVYGYFIGLVLLYIMNRMEVFEYDNLRLPKFVFNKRK